MKTIDVADANSTLFRVSPKGHLPAVLVVTRRGNARACAYARQAGMRSVSAMVLAATATLTSADRVSGSPARAADRSWHVEHVFFAPSGE